MISAVIHVLGDGVASAGVLVAAVLITLTGWTPIDPILSIGHSTIQPQYAGATRTRCTAP